MRHVHFKRTQENTSITTACGASDGQNRIQTVNLIVADRRITGTQ